MVDELDRTLTLIRLELKRLDAGDAQGIGVMRHAAGVLVYDTQTHAVYEPRELLNALLVLPNDAGFWETWQALAALSEVST